MPCCTWWRMLDRMLDLARARTAREGIEGGRAGCSLESTKARADLARGRTKQTTLLCSVVLCNAERTRLDRNSAEQTSRAAGLMVFAAAEEATEQSLTSRTAGQGADHAQRGAAPGGDGPPAVRRAGDSALHRTHTTNDSHGLLTRAQFPSLSGISPSRWFRREGGDASLQAYLPKLKEAGPGFIGWLQREDGDASSLPSLPAAMVLRQYAERPCMSDYCMSDDHMSDDCMSDDWPPWTYLGQHSCLRQYAERPAD